MASPRPRRDRPVPPPSRGASGQSLKPEREHRDARSGGCGFELAILNRGNDPAYKAPPPPDLASLRQLEAADQSRFNRGSCLGCGPRQWRAFRQQGASSAWRHARGGEVSTGKSLRFFCPRNEPRRPWVVAERQCSGTNPGGGGTLLLVSVFAENCQLEAEARCMSEPRGGGSAPVIGPGCVDRAGRCRGWRGFQTRWPGPFSRCARSDY